MLIGNANSAIRPFQFASSANASAPAPAASESGPQDGVTLSSNQPPAQSQPQPPVQPQPQPPAQQQPPTQEEPPLAKWTILQYSASDNNLYGYMYDDVALMEKVGSDPGTHLVVQIDHGNHQPQGAQRIYLERDTEAPPVQGPSRNMSLFKAVGTPGGHGPNGNIDSPITQELGQINMSDPKVLADFVKWGMEKYPAEHYMLIISDHGDAWKGACEDDTHNGWMQLPQIREGLEEAQAATGKKLDIIGFDACLMANAEVGYELKDVANYLVGSEQTEGADGWPYQAILTPDALSTIKAQNTAGAIDLEPADLAAQVVNKAADNQGHLPTMSAFDLSQMQGVADAVKGFKDALVATDTAGPTLKDLRRGTQSFSGYRDVIHFAERLIGSEAVTDANLKAGAQTVIDAVKTAVIAEQHSAAKAPGARGMTIEMSRTSSKQYQETAFQKETDWNAAVQRIDRSEPSVVDGGDVPINPITGLPIGK